MLPPNHPSHIHGCECGTPCQAPSCSSSSLGMMPYLILPLEALFHLDPIWHWNKAACLLTSLHSIKGKSENAILIKYPIPSKSVPAYAPHSNLTAVLQSVFRNKTRTKNPSCNDKCIYNTIIFPTPGRNRETVTTQSDRMNQQCLL